MIGITLRQLHYFDALARTGHFGRAADLSTISQPALSMQIQELEAQLGVTLVERGKRGVTLTRDGEAIARRAAAILGDVQDLIDYARHGKSVLTGMLKFGVIPTVAPYLLPPLLPQLRQDYPELELHVRETQTSVLLRELEDGKLDVVLIALPVDIQGLDSLKLMEDRFVIAVPAGYETSSQLVAGPELLQNERLLLLEEGHCFRDQALSYCSLQQTSSVNTLGASSFATLVRMVANGMGVTLLPEMAIATEIRSQEIRVLPLAEPQPRRTLGLVWRRSSPRKQDFAALATLIQGLRL
nr:hydrogen peroxide-inducible genes activator [uncultured Gellertiella sp.]